MAWLTTGTTAPFLVVAPVAGGFAAGSSQTAGNLWVYRSTADTVGTMTGSQYFIDGYRRGMRQYDIVALADVNTPRFTWAYVSSLSTVSTGGATVALFSST